MHVQPYLNFNGRCEEALEFYKKALGAKPEMLMRFNECPDPHPPGMMPPGTENKILHVSFRVGDSVIMASDCQSTGAASFQGISLSLSVSNEGEAKRYFTALSDGGMVQMPLAKTFFSPAFGVVVDRLGVNWMIVVQHPAAQAKP